jgi:hypothetical protein
MIDFQPELRVLGKGYPSNGNAKVKIPVLKFENIGAVIVHLVKQYIL